MDEVPGIEEDATGLREELSRLSRIIQASPDRFIVMDSDGRYLKITTSDERLIADKPERLLGRTIYETFPAEMAEPLASFVLRATRGQMSGLIEYRLPVQGEMRWFEGRAAPAGMGPEGKPIAVFVARDITDRKRTEEALRKALDEKSVLLRELQHRVKNNLSMVSSLVSIESANLVNEEDRKSFEHIQDRIRAMALIYDMLYKTESVLDLDLAVYLKTLLESLQESYLGGKYGRIKLEMDLADVRLDLKRAVPLGIIVNELVTNSLKYAFPGNREGSICVNLRTKNGETIIIIEDDGVGKSGDSSVYGSGCDEGAGTGLNLVRVLVDQIKGCLTSGPGPGGAGLRYQISFDSAEPKAYG